uniref:Uncharacterized protein n=1 Tax=Arundo donax TaxID=35708 RepID=A0A0A8Z2S4_ARUDO
MRQWARTMLLPTRLADLDTSGGSDHWA